MNEIIKIYKTIKQMFIIMLLMLLLILLMFVHYSYADSININLTIIKTIESSGDPNAFNRSSGARGLYQITPIVLKEYNSINKTQYTINDLFDSDINTMIAKWYLTKRIPQMLRYFKKPITINNVLISYNAGINYVVKELPLPSETRQYIRKYNERINND